MTSKDSITKTLIDEGFIGGGEVRVSPLEGGVSSDIFLLTDGSNKYVVKQALPRLQVEDTWQADVSRNQTEQAFIHYLQDFNPDAVPQLLYADADQPFFVMEYLGPSFKNWKRQMLKGVFEKQTARRAAELLSEIHVDSWGDDQLEKTFNTTENFISLRIEPYLITTGERHPELAKMFAREARRLEQHREALVHGDFSPKNMMVKGDRLVLLDHEVAWFGDPAFDMAFLLNHLYLKMLVHYRKKNEIRDLTRVVWHRYFAKLGFGRRREMEIRIGRLLLMLMLARIDGKSPVEYLDEKEKKMIRSFVYNRLPDQTFTYSEINSQWKSKLKSGQFDY